MGGHFSKRKWCEPVVKKGALWGSVCSTGHVHTLVWSKKTHSRGRGERSENTGQPLTMEELDHMARECRVCAEGFLPGRAPQRPGGVGHTSGGHLLLGACRSPGRWSSLGPAPDSPVSSLPTRFSQPGRGAPPLPPPGPPQPPPPQLPLPHRPPRFLHSQ